MKHGYIRVNITFNVYFTKIKTGHWSLFFIRQVIGFRLLKTKTKKTNKIITNLTKTILLLYQDFPPLGFQSQ